MKILIEESTLQMALEALEYNQCNWRGKPEAITALRSALDAAEQVEPVAWVDISGRCGGHRGEYDWKCTKCGKVDWFASYTDPNKERVKCSCHAAPTTTDSELRTAAQAVVENWRTIGICGGDIARLREALKK